MRSLTTRVALAILAAVLAGCGATKTVTVTRSVTRTVTKATTTTLVPARASACSGGDLGGSFTEVRGSAAAGSITYALTLTNRSSAPCYVSGIPELRPLDADGGALPTIVSAAQPGPATAAKIVLEPGASGKADARFSPDVPGPGEQHPGACEPTAHQLQVTVGGGSVTVPVSPPTPVCSNGAVHMSPLAAS